MKRITSLALVMLMAFGGAYAKDRTSKHTMVKNDLITVSYGKVTKKDAVTIPASVAWRTGVDEPTLITLTKGCMFGGRQVSPGTYSLITVANSGQWEILLNTDLSNGTFDYQAIKDKTVLQTTAPVQHTATSVDGFSIDLDNDGIVITWDNNKVAFPVHPW